MLNISSPFTTRKNKARVGLLGTIIRNAGIVLMGNTGASVLNFISFTIIVNKLGAHSFALFVLTQTYVLIINGLLNIQTWESMIKFGSSDLGKGELKNTVKINFFLDLISALIACGVGLLMVNPVVEVLGWEVEIVDLLFLYCLSIPFNLVSFTIGIPRMYKMFSMLARIQVFSALLKIFLVVLAARTPKDVLIYVGIYLAVDIIRNLVLIVFSLNLLKTNGLGDWWRGKMRINPAQIKFIWWTNLRAIVRIPVQYCDMIIISWVISMEAVGIYKVYKEVAGLLGRLGDPINQTIFPEFSQLIGKNETESAAGLAKKLSLVLLGVSFLVSLILIMASKIFVGKIYGVEFLSSISGLYVLIGLYGVSLFILPINSLFVAAGFAKFGFYIVVFTNFLYLIVAYYFGKNYGIYGIIAAYGVQMVINQGLKLLILGTYRTGWGHIIR